MSDSRQQTTPAPAAAAQPAAAQAPPPRSALDAYYTDWEQKVKAMNAASAAVDWSKYDFSKLSPKDLSVQFGPMLTEEEFKKVRRQQ